MCRRRRLVFWNSHCVLEKRKENEGILAAKEGLRERKRIKEVAADINMA